MHSDFQARRQQLLNQLDPHTIAIIPAEIEMIRNGDTHFPFRQNSDFYYLTGFEEPEAVAVFMPQHEEGEFLLFNRVRDKAKEIWTGPRAGQEGAVKHYGANKAYPIDDFKSRLPELLHHRHKIYYDFGVYPKFDSLLINTLNSLKSQIRKGINAPDEFHSLQALTHEMRLVKSKYEQDLLRYVGTVSANAHKRAMQLCKPGLYEYHLAAEIQYEFLRNGCTGPAYPSIVGSGANACILHYILNNAELKEGDLVLIDAGGEYGNYSADITRTFPVNGKFTQEQRQIYELVLKAQKAGIEQAKAGNLWSSMQETIIHVITTGLVDLGILKGDVNTLIEQKAYFTFYMHNSGHWLGLDTHDAGRYKVNNHWRTLCAGMVMTVEPGLYISANTPGVEKKWWNIGVRIEDDVLITETGNEVLTKAVPKEIDDIEALMSH